jgi:hypothetical protein
MVANTLAMREEGELKVRVEGQLIFNTSAFEVKPVDDR